MKNECMQPNEIQMRLAENVKAIRKRHKMTQFELAEAANISEAMVKSIELAHSWSSERTLLCISRALDTDVLHFFMPVRGSVEISQCVRRELEEVILQKYQETVAEVARRILP